MYNFSEHIKDYDQVSELLVVSYPQRDNCSIELWVAKAGDNEIQLADIFYDGVNDCNIIKFIIDGQEINLEMNHLVTVLAEAAGKLHRATSACPCPRIEA